MSETGTGGRSAYEVFVDRLLSLCAAEGTLADACRATGINRQQFNKYLSGKFLPSAENLKKISAYLDIESTQLFTLKPNATPQVSGSRELYWARFCTASDWLTTAALRWSSFPLARGRNGRAERITFNGFLMGPHQQTESRRIHLRDIGKSPG